MYSMRGVVFAGIAMQSFHPLMRMLSYFILGVSGLTLAQVLSKQASWQLLTVAFIKSLTWLWLRDLTIIAASLPLRPKKSWQVKLPSGISPPAPSNHSTN